MIPVNEPFIGEKELEYVTECLKTGWISSAGRFIEEFEQKWADYCGMKYGIAVSNGTVALEVALQTLGLKPDDEVIIPSFTIISCAFAVIYAGAKPVLVDSEPRTWTMDVDKIEEKITEKTKAIMPVHIYGHPCNMEKIWEIAEKYNLKVIEDAAEAHGAEYRKPPPLNPLPQGEGRLEGSSINPIPVAGGDAQSVIPPPLTGGGEGEGAWRRCGSLGDLSCFSFYANKIITTGEGGMILTNNEGYAEKARSIRNLCFRRERRFYHTELGNNFRLTNLQAAIGLAQLERIDELVEKKRWMGQAYTERLKGIRGLTLPVEEPWAKNVYWMYGVVIDESVMNPQLTKDNENPPLNKGGDGGVISAEPAAMDAVEFAEHLKELGVETRPFFLGMHEQPVFHDMGLFKGEHYPVAERIARQGLYLPSGMTLTEEQIDEVVKAVKKVLTSKIKK